MSQNRRIDDFAILEDAKDDDLILVSSEDETYTMKVHTLKEAVKGDADRAEAAAEAAKTAAQEAVQTAQEAKTSAELALFNAESAAASTGEAKAAAEAAAASALNAENKATKATRDAQAALAAAQSAEADMDGLVPRVETLERQVGNMSIDPDDLGLEQDEDTGYVYPTYRGVRSENGIPLAATGGGGGGGASSLTYTVTLKNALNSRTLTVPDGQPAELKFLYTSVDEEGVGDGAGVGSVTVDGVKVLTTSVEQGTRSVDIAAYLTPGEHTVKLRVENSEGTARTLSYTVTLVSLRLSTTMTPLASYEDEVTFYYTATGVGTKTVHFIMDGEEIGTAEVTSSGRSRSFIIPAQEHGGHLFEVYAELTMGDATLKSNTLTLGMLWVDPTSTKSAIVSPFAVTNTKQGEVLNIEYLVFDPTTELAAVTLSVLNPDGTVYSSLPLSANRNPQVWAVADYPQGSVTFRLETRDATLDKVVEVADSGVVIEPVTDSRVLNFDAIGRNNLEADPAVWTDGTTEATFNNVAFSGADGWLTDEKGSAMLRLLPGSEMTLPFTLFAADCRDNGATVEVEMSTNNVRDYDSVVMSCLSNGRGFKIASQYAQLNSEQSEIAMQFKEEQRVRVSFVVSPKNLKPLIYVYVDGVLCGAIQYPENDDFSQNPAAGITIGAESSGIDIYRIVLYTKGLDRQEILANYVADRPTLKDRIDCHKRNDILDVSDDIVIPKLPATVPYMIISCAELPQSKGNKKTCAITYVDPANSSKSFTASGVEIDVQGTSSAGYKKKNFLIKLLEGLTMTANGVDADTYALRGDSVPVNTFCLKADVASSDSANNVELVRLYNRTCPYRHPAMVADPRVRYGIDGKPIVVFWQNTATGETTFWGKYNFNNDKSTPEVFGFGEGYECWEIKNNTSDRVVFKRSDYGTGWEEDFEAIYPKGLKDTTHLKALTDWLVSTDRSAVSSQSEKTTRLNKFRDEFSRYFVKDAMLFYYLFTETFLMVDNRAKNFFPVYDPNLQRWYPFPYDFDTALGINNEGQLAFDYDLEDQDKLGGYDVYNAQESVLWNNIRDAFPADLAAMYVKLRNTSDSTGVIPFSYEAINKEFVDHQGVWPEAVWNEDAYEKYLRPLFDDNDASYLTMLQGDKASQRDWWMFNGFRYRDSKYRAGDANTNFITLRCYSLGSITVIPYSHIWPRIKYGSYTMPGAGYNSTTGRCKRNTPMTIANPNDKLNDTETYIYSADRIADIGDLSPLQVGYADFTAARKLQKLKLGDGAKTYQNTKLTELYVGNNDLLTELDVQNCTGLTQYVDLSACDGLETVKAKGSSTTGFSLPVGGHIKTLELPRTVTNFTIQNQKFLETVTFEGYDSLATLRVENTPNIPLETIINSAGSLNRVRLVGVTWDAESVESLTATINRLKGCIGQDASGSNTDKAVVVGTVRVPDITDELLDEINTHFPDLVVVANGVALYLVRYLNYDNTVLYRSVLHEGDDAIDPVAQGLIDAPVRVGEEGTGYVFSQWDNLPTNVSRNYSIVAQFTTAYAVWFYDEGVLLHTQWVQAGLPCPDPVAEGYISAPTRVSSAQYEYNFKGWDVSLAAINKPTTATAEFSQDVRTYTVYFCNGDQLLQTIENVPYGGTATYNGDPPVMPDVDDPSEYTFVGWDPSPERITGETMCYAMFVFMGSVARDIASRTIEGNYENARVESVGPYAFYGCTALTGVNLPGVKTLGERAFYGCTALTSFQLPEVTEAGTNAFAGCDSPDGFTLTLPKLSSVAEPAFAYCNGVTELTLPSVTSVCNNGIARCNNLVKVDFGASLASLDSYALSYGKSLETLILRRTDAVVTCGQYMFHLGKTPYIYVPRALVDSYKVATRWKEFADKFRAIEDYPEITGG